MKKYLIVLFLIVIGTLPAEEEWTVKYIECLKQINQQQMNTAEVIIDSCIEAKEDNPDFFYYEALLQKSKLRLWFGDKTNAYIYAKMVVEESGSEELIVQAHLVLAECEEGEEEMMEECYNAIESCKKLDPRSVSKKKVLGFISRPELTSIDKLKCFLIHNRLTYSNETIEIIDSKHYAYEPFCHCGCEKSVSKIKEKCDVCGDDITIPPCECLKGEDALKTTCETGCWMARVAAVGWCNKQFKDQPWRQAACVDFTVHLLAECYKCCASKDDFIKCTAPFSTIAEKLYKIWEESGNALAVNWVCHRCGNYNGNSWPPFICRNCGQFKNLP